jgi:hypothetical protein
MPYTRLTLTVKDFSVTSTTVEEVHEILCDDAVRIGNLLVENEPRLGREWKGGHPVFRNGSPYNEGRLVIEITDEYKTAGPRVRDIFRELGHTAIRRAIQRNGELFVGMILGEARAGRNYFDRHGEQVPTTLF